MYMLESLKMVTLSGLNPCKGENTRFKLSVKRPFSAYERSENSGSGGAGRCGVGVPCFPACSLAAQGCVFLHHLKALAPEKVLEVFYTMEAPPSSTVPQSHPANRPRTAGFVVGNYRSAWDHQTGTKAKTS